MRCAEARRVAYRDIDKSWHVSKVSTGDIVIYVAPRNGPGDRFVYFVWQQTLPRSLYFAALMIAGGRHEPHQAGVSRTAVSCNAANNKSYSIVSGAAFLARRFPKHFAYARQRSPQSPLPGVKGSRKTPSTARSSAGLMACETVTTNSGPSSFCCQKARKSCSARKFGNISQSCQT